MLLAIDVGNTNITCALFRKKEMVASFRLMTKQSRTSDEYGMTLISLITSNSLNVEDVKAVIIASVVPKVNYSLNSAIIKYFHITPVEVGPGIRTGIRLALDNPKQVGADRILDAVAAYEIYGGPVIVIDYGTATTFDFVTGDGALIGGATAPGIQTSAASLWNATAKLPEVEIRRPYEILGKETIPSMQAGIYYSQIGATEMIIRRIKEECGADNVKTVATGGLGSMIKEGTDMIDIYDPSLTMYGLQIVYSKQKRKSRSPKQAPAEKQE